MSTEQLLQQIIEQNKQINDKLIRHDELLARAGQTNQPTEERRPVTAAPAPPEERALDIGEQLVRTLAHKPPPQKGVLKDLNTLSAKELKEKYGKKELAKLERKAREKQRNAERRALVLAPDEIIENRRARALRVPAAHDHVMSIDVDWGTVAKTTVAVGVAVAVGTAAYYGTKKAMGV